MTAARIQPTLIRFNNPIKMPPRKNTESSIPNYPLAIINYIQKLEKLILPIIILSCIALLIELYSIIHLSVQNIYTQISIFRIVSISCLLAIVFFLLRKKYIHTKNNYLYTIAGFIEDISSPFLMINEKGEIIRASNSFYSAFNINKETVIGSSLNNFLKEDQSGDLSKWLSHPEATFSGKFTIDKQHDSGLVNLIPKPYNWDNNLCYLANIKFAKTFQEEVSKYQEFIDSYKSITSASRNVVWDYNFETGESHYNESIHKIFGYTVSEIKGNPTWWSGNIHPEDRSRVIAHVDKCIAENYLIWTDEYRFMCANGDYKIVDDHGLIQRDATGKPSRLLGFMNDITEQTKLQRQLKEEQLLFKIELAKAISDAQENERKNISEELHDNVCQVLGGVKLFIDHCVLSETKNDDLLRQSSGHLNNVMQELRKMAHVLSPYSVEKFGLLSSLRELVYFATNFRKATVNLDTSQFDETILSGYKKLLLYRIVQEQLNNIIKHSHATKIDIELKNTGNNCLFLICDNGVGMQFNEKNIGFGLKNIQHRVEMLNGNVKFITSPDNGFRMNIEFKSS